MFNRSTCVFLPVSTTTQSPATERTTTPPCDCSPQQGAQQGGTPSGNAPSSTGQFVSVQVGRQSCAVIWRVDLA